MRGDRIGYVIKYIIESVLSMWMVIYSGSIGDIYRGYRGNIKRLYGGYIYI